MNNNQTKVFRSSAAEVTAVFSGVSAESHIIVYKKVRVDRNGTPLPLFIDNKKPFVIGEWMHCEYHPTKGFAPRSCGTDDNGNPIGGWHCCFQPIAPHLADQLSSGERRVWIKCEAKGQRQVYDRPWNQGGSWILIEWLRPLAILSEEEVSTINTSAAVLGCA